MQREIRVGVSACLLGERVRYDGGHKRDAFLTEILGPFVEWVAVCPEVEIGLGTPREPIRLVSRGAGAPRLVTQTNGADLTRRMERFAEAKARELAALCLDGYVLKRASPSCGLFEVPIHGNDGEPPHPGRGVYAALLARRLPTLPMEEEGRLLDRAIREHFIERLFTAARWRLFVARAPRLPDLAAFHGAHTLILRAHSASHEASLARLVAAAGRTVTRGLLAEYGRLLMEAVAVRAPRAGLLQEVAGAVGKDLEREGTEQMRAVSEDYQTMTRVLRAAG
jgi:uncharacterized protein YbbK (DUF523 family)/uncharacterized protein YbgA (DUF1722 family)